MRQLLEDAVSLRSGTCDKRGKNDDEMVSLVRLCSHSDMNIASWIILIIVVIWIGVAIKVAFFGGFGKKGRSCHGTHHDANLPSDEDLRLPSACMGCSKGSCAGCASARDVPTPVIHESRE